MEAYIKSIELAKKIAKLASNKKTIDPIILEVKGLTDITDYFVVCHGTSSRQIKTIADYIVESLGKNGVFAIHNDTDIGYSWVVLDYIDVIVHIFNEETRQYYGLERLWGDARVIAQSLKRKAQNL